MGACGARNRRCFYGLSVALGLTLTLASSRSEAQSPPAAPDKIAVGDWQLSPSMEVRVRGEYRRDAPDLGGLDLFGRLSPRVRDAWMVMERARLGLGVERGAVRAQITLQDARALGSPVPSARFVGSQGVGQFGPYEAFAEMHSTSGARPHYLRLGRQAVVWGEGRMIGNADFAATGRSLDAARGHLAFGNFDFEALAAILEVPGPLGAPFGETAGPSRSGVQLHGLTAKWTIDPLLKVEVFGLVRISRSDGSDLDGSRFAASRLSGERYTASLRVSGDSKGWTYGAEGAYQLGTTSSLAIGGNDISAWAAAAHVSKTLDQLLLTPTFRLAGSYASGDNGRGVYKQFDPLLPDPQRFHGQMDLFSWSNMMDVGARAQIVPWTDTTFALDYRYARLANGSGEWIGGYMNVVGSQTAPPAITTSPPATPASTDEELGHEVDLVFTYRPWLPLELRAGWSGLLLGDGARSVMRVHARGSRDSANVIQPSNIAQYAFLQATLTMP